MCLLSVWYEPMSCVVIPGGEAAQASAPVSTRRAQLARHALTVEGVVPERASTSAVFTRFGSSPLKSLVNLALSCGRPWSNPIAITRP